MNIKDAVIISGSELKELNDQIEKICDAYNNALEMNLKQVIDYFVPLMKKKKLFFGSYINKDLENVPEILIDQYAKDHMFGKHGIYYSGDFAHPSRVRLKLDCCLGEYKSLLFTEKEGSSEFSLIVPIWKYNKIMNFNFDKKIRYNQYYQYTGI